MTDLYEELKKLYAEESKHSQYQQLPSCLEGILDFDSIAIGSKYEKERFDYIKDRIDLGKSVIDIGGNSGFFTLESVTSGVDKVDYWEGNNTHAKFVEIASKAVGYENNIHIHNEYFNFEGMEGYFDTVFLLNVIHHLGSDFEEGISLDKARLEMLQMINNMAYIGKKMVFQMGYNWGGDILNPIFEHGTKQEMIDYISDGTKRKWRIERIGIAVKRGDIVVYEDASSDNLIRFDEYGEFLNRPIFIMDSLLL